MIENYKRLLYAIFNVYTDNDKGNLAPIIVYDTKNNELPVAIFKNAKYCAKFFKTTNRVISCDICKKTLKHKRYKLERIDINEERSN